MKPCKAMTPAPRDQASLEQGFAAQRRECDALAADDHQFRSCERRDQADEAAEGASRGRQNRRYRGVFVRGESVDVAPLERTSDSG